ncbi:MAG: dicarboxylate/amino acid:cation symporter [Caulobacteraceae bacterium]|nr:dicarboxylate/amino acid:cation symporter [Caulobacter sp.]
MSRSFTLFILAGMGLGLVAGALVSSLSPDVAHAKAWADGFSLVTDVFLRLIRMIIAPLVLSTLTVGIAHMGRGSAVGRIGLRAIGWFVAAGVVSLVIGMVAAELLRPGAGLALPSAPAGEAGVATSLSPSVFLQHVFPASVVDAMAKNEVLQIVVFAVFLGLAMAAVGEPARPLLLGLESLAAVMLKVTNYVMLAAPAAVFAAIAAAVATQGLGVLVAYAKFVGGFYGALAVLWAVLLAAGGAVVGFGRVRALFGMIRQPALLAFSTATSEAAYPRTLEELQRFGVSRRIASFVLPLGYSFNLDGSMMYCTFASLFIAQAYGVHLDLAQRGLMLLLFLVTSKGIAGVPRASLVVIAATLPYFRIPEAGLLLVLGVDHFLDMGRSATNVVGNAVAAAVTARWEGELGPAHAGAMETAPS